MFCEVITLRSAGVRLRLDEWPAPVAGQLRMWPSDRLHNNLRRGLRQLMHYQREGTQMVPRLLLLDPVLVDVLGDALLMRGCETSSAGGRIAEHEQLWLVRPRISMEGPPLPPFDARPYAKQQLPSTPTLAAHDPLPS